MAEESVSPSIPNLKLVESKIQEEVEDGESKSARSARLMNAPILHSMRSNSSDDLKTKPLKVEVEPTPSQNDNVKPPMTPRTFRSKSHIWCASKGRHMILSCFICHQLFGISPAEIIKKCRLCRCRAHQQCALSHGDQNCKRPHEMMIYDPEITESRTPLIVFINPKSGAQAGTKLFGKLCTLLGPGQVFDLSKGGPEPGLQKFRDVPNIRILVAGGDGTVSWVLEAVTKLNFPYNPPVAVLPLGTGNDLARQFGWGGGYAGEKLLPLFGQIQRAKVTPLDRWKVCIYGPKGNEEPPRVKIMNNYLSIGTDADIACNFHHRRQEQPHLFTSRLINKMWYAYEGTRTLTKESPRLKDMIDIEIDGERCELGNDLLGLMVVNLRNYAAGQDLWGTVSQAEAARIKKKLLVPRCDDGILEVVGVGGALDVGTVVSGLNKPRKIGQAIAVQINFKKIPHFDTASIQVDGEPWKEKLPFTMKVCILDQANLLFNTAATHQSLQRSNSMES